MVTTVNILDLLKEHFGSDYKTAKAFGIPQSRISQLRHVGGVLSDEQGLKAAEILNFPEELIILSLAAERAVNSPAFGILTHLADSFDHRKVGAYLVLVICAGASYFQSIPVA